MSDVEQTWTFNVPVPPEVAALPPDEQEKFWALFQARLQERLERELRRESRRIQHEALMGSASPSHPRGVLS